MDKKPYISADDSTKHKLINMSKTINVLRKVIGMVNGSEFINQVYSTAGGEDIEIYQNDPSGYKTGDRTNVKEGEFKLSDSTIKVEDFIIVEIEKAAEVPMEPAAEEFNEGEAPKEPAAEEFTEEPAEEVTEEEIVPEIFSEDNDLVVKLQGVITEMQETIKELQKQISEMTNESIEEKVEQISTDIEKMKIGNQEFEEMAAEAIDRIASQTSSVWNSGINKESVLPQGNSIFKRALSAKKQAESRK